MASNSVAVITIDGPSGSGKGTVAKRLASHYGLRLLDSGALYRVLGVAALRHGVELNDAPALAQLAARLDVCFEVDPASDGVEVILEGARVGQEIRTEEAGRVASIVAAVPDVRTALLQRQRDFATAPGVVADGRDMGTVVFPDAPVKVYLTASAEERARRRYNQLLEKGFSANLAAILQDVKARDERDTGRAVAPLKPAPDALQLDSTDLSIDQVVEQIEARVKLLLPQLQG